MEIYYIYNKLRRDFGRMTQFTDQPVEARGPPTRPELTPPPNILPAPR